MSSVHGLKCGIEQLFLINRLKSELDFTISSVLSKKLRKIFSCVKYQKAKDDVPFIKSQFNMGKSRTLLQYQGQTDKSLQ